MQHSLLWTFLFPPSQMATVYSRVMSLQEQRKFPFKFNPKRIQKVGRMIRDQWDKEHPFVPPTVESAEATGIFMVSDYPSYFIPEMDAQILEYTTLVSEIRTQKVEKVQHQLFSPAPTPPIKQKRKRLPICSGSSNGVKIKKGVQI